MDKKDYKIKYETEKALRIERDGSTFWIPKTWLNENGELSELALRAYQKAKKRDEKSRESAKKVHINEINVNELAEMIHQSAKLSSVKLIWLKELTALVALLFSHQNMRDPSNQVYAIDVWNHIKNHLNQENK